MRSCSSSTWRRFAAAALCCFAVGATQAAAVVRQVPSGGTVQIRNLPAGKDGLKSPEFSPTFDKVPKLQDGPDGVNAAGAGTASALRAAGLDTPAHKALQNARQRMVNRSIARAVGHGTALPGESVQANVTRQGAATASTATASTDLLGSFDGVTMRDTRLASGGNQFSVEPPDQALCVGNGFVFEAVNDVLRVYDRQGTPQTDPVALNAFYGYAPAINRGAGTFGPSLTDPTCYYDPQVKRFFLVVLTLDTDPASGNLTGSNHLDLAVSASADPRASWTIYRIPVQDDGTQGTPVHTACPCLGDYPHIGADEHGIYLTTNEFPFAGGFNSAQIYALSKKDLVRGAVSLTLVQIDTIDHLLEGTPGFTVWPAVSPAGDFARVNGGTEYFLSSQAVFNDSGADHRLRLWALGNTKSLDGNSPDITLVDTTVRVHNYAVPPLSTQRGVEDAPLAKCINDTTLSTPFGAGCWNYLFTAKPDPVAVPELLDSNDSRMQQVMFSGGRLYAALDTAVEIGGKQLAGFAYYAIRPFSQAGSAVGIVENEGQIGVPNNNVNYPAIAALPNGKGVIAFTLTGPDYYPTASYVRLGPNGHVGPVRIAAQGRGPDDGFTGYDPFNPGTANARWGDYGAAAVDGDQIFFASEYIGQACSFASYVDPSKGLLTCNGTRVALGNWGTRISRIKP